MRPMIARPSVTEERNQQQTLLSKDHLEHNLLEKPPPYEATPTPFPFQLAWFKPEFLTKRIIISTIVLSLLATLTFAGLYLTNVAPTTSASSFKYPCGSTPDEALAVGCKFDVINYSWQLPECFYQEIHDRYYQKAQEHGPLRLYGDEAYTQVLPTDTEVYSRTARVWSEHRFHLIHCMYTFELMHHSLILGRPVVEPVAEWNHTKHCAATGALETFEVKDTVIDMSFYKCVELR